jgi:amino acid permease
MGVDAFEITYNKTLKSVTQLYVANLIICIMCIIVLTFFLYKALPAEQQSGLFNEYLGGGIVLLIFIVVCWTLNFFSKAIIASLLY